MELPRLSVPIAAAADVIKGSISDGEKLLSDYARGPHNPTIVLRHTRALSNWSRATEDRVNALFERPVVRANGLLTAEGSGLQLGILRDLLSHIDPPKPTIAAPQNSPPFIGPFRVCNSNFIH
jgi:hypothetical protein